MNAQLTPTLPAADRILRVSEVAARVGMCRATIYRRIATSEFPAAISLGGRSVGWKLSDIEAWIASRQAVQS